MGFNYAKEKRKFDKHWAILRCQYEDAGMSQEAIKTLYDFDRKWFNSCRRYESHLAELPEDISIESLPQPGMEASVGDILATTNRMAWLDEIENEMLLQKLMLLSEDNIRLLTLLVFEECSQSEIAQQKHCTQQAISGQLCKIRKILEKSL